MSPELPIAPWIVGSGISVGLVLIGVTWRWRSASLFKLATVVFTWPALVLMGDLHHGAGVVRLIGWIGLLCAGPTTLGLVVRALRRYGVEHGEHRREA